VENGNGGFITQDEVRQIVDYCRERHIEIIPEAPCFSHCFAISTGSFAYIVSWL
jgi:hexosaminidase